MLCNLNVYGSATQRLALRKPQSGSGPLRMVPMQAAIQQVQPLDLVLYDDPHSLYCSKIRIALLHKGVNFKSAAVPCGSTQSPEFKKISPLGKIPALVVGSEQGTQALLESEVIAEYLEDAFPAHPPLLPAHPLLKAQARTISRFHDLYFEPSLRRLYPQVAPSRRDPAQVEAAVQELQLRLQQLETLLQQADRTFADVQPSHAGQVQPSYAVAGQLTLADCGFAPAFYYADLILPVVCKPGQELKYTARQLAWKEALSQDVHVQEAMRVLKPAALEWLHSRLGIPMPVEPLCVN